MKPLWVSDHLSIQAVLFFAPGTDKEKILSRLVESLPVPDPAAALNAVLEREKKSGTSVAENVFIPHARLPRLQRIELAVGSDGTRLFFLFLSPQGDTKAHLLFLSGLSSLFQADGFARELLNAMAPHEIVRKIRETEKGL